MAFVLAGAAMVALAGLGVRAAGTGNAALHSGKCSGESVRVCSAGREFHDPLCCYSARIEHRPEVKDLGLRRRPRGLRRIAAMKLTMPS